MAEGAQSDSCEEPDADFFDTFFDDGVLETIGEVLGNQNPDADSSCEALDVTQENAIARKDELEKSTIGRSFLQENSNNAPTNEKVIVLKPAHIKDQTISKNVDRATTSKSSLSSQITIDVRNVEESKYRALTPIRHRETGNSLSDSQGLVCNEKNVTSVDLNNLLSKVHKFLKDTPFSKEKDKAVKDKDANDLTSINKCQSSRKETEESGPGPGIKKNDEVAPSLSCDTKEKLSSESDINRIYVKKEETRKEQITSPVKVQISRESGDQTDNSGYSDTFSSGVGTSEYAESVSLHKVLPTQDDTEKENDLTLEDNCPKNKPQQSSPGKKISLNLKTQILASTTILNSGSPEKAIQSSNSSVDNRRKDSAASSSRYEIKGLSPISDEDTQLTKHNKKKKREHGSTRDSTSPDHEKHKYPSREKKQKKKKQRDNSPKSARRDRDIKKTRLNRKRSRSRSPSPKYRDSRYNSWKQTKRDRLPEVIRRKRRRSSSQSLSPSSSRRYMRRSSRSPLRHRSRSRSYSPGHRFRQSPSPTARRRRSSRSRSRSPFINEICRLKRQWDKEDERKRSSSQYMQSHLGVVPAHSPAAQSWPSETGCSSTIVSNMMSVQVHSTSFTFDHLSQSHLPGNFIAPPMPPDNRPYGAIPPMPPMGVLPSAPRSEALPPYHSDDVSNRSHSDSIVLPPLFLPPPLPAPSPPRGVDNHPTSMLRKQLDILKSTVVSLSEPSSSSNKFGPKDVQTCNQLSLPSHHEPKKNQDISLPSTNTLQTDSLLSNHSSKSNSNNLKNKTASSSKDDVGEGAIEMKASTFSSTVESPSRTPDSENARNDTSVSSHKLSPSSSSDPSHLKDCNPAIDDTCTPPILEVQVNNHATKSKSSKSDESSKPPADPDVPAFVANQTQAAEKPFPDHQTQHNDNDNAVIEECDSDCIIEELPPKQPVELICLSEDEMEDNNEISEQLNHEFDLLNMGLDLTLQPTQKDSEKGISQVISSKPQKRKRKKHKKSKREAAAHSLVEIDVGGKTCELQQTNEKAGDSSEESCDSILKECREMIDSLRIGRFKVVDEDQAAELPAHTEKEKPTSIIRQSCKVEFSFTQRPIVEEVFQTKDVSTNTPIQLCIDVCTETDSYVLSRNFMTQTDLSCRECTEKEALIKEMNDQLLSLKKERDELYSIILSLKKTPTIPGLDFSTKDFKASQQTIEGNSSPSDKNLQMPKAVPIKEKNLCNDVQSATKSQALPRHLIVNKSTSKKPFENGGTNFFTSQAEDVQRETILSYEYNHSLPN